MSNYFGIFCSGIAGLLCPGMVAYFSPEYSGYRGFLQVHQTGVKLLPFYQCKPKRNPDLVLHDSNPCLAHSNLQKMNGLGYKPLNVGSS
jgi:hypothetical protein